MEKLVLDGNAERRYSRIGWTVLAISAVLSLTSIVIGGLAYGNGIQVWANAGYVFTGWGMLDWLIGLCGAALAACGIVAAGICLRLVGWNAAPWASLGLAIMSVAFLVTTFLIYSQTNTAPEDNSEILLLQALCILGLFVISLPPFLHWLSSRPRLTSADASRKRSE